MTTFTLYPSVYLSGMDGSFYGETPSTTVPDTIRSYIADTDDATWAARAAPPYIVTKEVTFELPDPAIPADEFIARAEGFVRWSLGGDGGTVSSIPYLGATPPTSQPYVTTDGRTTPLTSTPSVQNVAWSLTDANSCKLLWLEGSVDSQSWVRTHQVGARLKTIKRSTCTVTAQTETANAYPPISVPVTSTLDWESAEVSSSPLRKVDVELRIELGGTVPEGGTLVATANDSFQLSATGTLTRTLTPTEPIPNGTYQMYTRATRNRATGTPLTDQVGAWSAAATLTMNVPPPATPTMVAVEDEVGDTVTVTVTPVATTNYTSPTIDVERSDDGGITWSAIRSGTKVISVFGQAKDFVDVELPRIPGVQYRARVNAIYTGTTTNTSAWTAPASVSLTPDGWNLKAVEVAGLAFVDVPVVGEIVQELDEDVGVFRPLDRRLPVVVAGELTGYDGGLELRLTDQAQWDTVKSLLEQQRVLLLQRPYGDQLYIRLIGTRGVVLWGTPTNPQRRVIVKYVETGAP